MEAIDGLLALTRDIRLLAIEARFQSFVGDLSGFADCIVAIAGLLEKFWADVHPQAYEGDFTLRQNILSGLDDWWQIIQPLQHLPMVRDKRADLVTYRHVAIASGAAQKRANETVLDLAEIHRALSAPENRAASDASYKAATNAAAALASIRNSFTANAGYEYVPSFDKLAEFLANMVTLFHAARPDLAESAVEAVQLAEEATGEQADAPRRRRCGCSPQADRPDGIDQDPGRRCRGTARRRDVFRGVRAVVAVAHPHPPGALAGRQVADTFARNTVT